MAYRNELMPFTSWRVPGWAIGSAVPGAGVEQLRRRLEAEARGESTGVEQGQEQQTRRRTLGGLLRDQFLGGGR